MTHNRLHCMNWQPSLPGVLVSILVLTGWVLRHRSIYVKRRAAEQRIYEDRDAYGAIRINWHDKASAIHHTVPGQGSLLGCHICVRNFILGGWSGYSSGKLSLALKKPPSLDARTRQCFKRQRREVEYRYALKRIRRAD